MPPRLSARSRRCRCFFPRFLRHFGLRATAFGTSALGARGFSYDRKTCEIERNCISSHIQSLCNLLHCPFLIDVQVLSEVNPLVMFCKYEIDLSMSQRDSGYTRIEHDAYPTPPWVTKALISHLPHNISIVWEPAAGSGKMLDVLRKYYSAIGTDIATGIDFLRETNTRGADTLITNPPYSHATEFIEHALKLTRSNFGVVAMLLRCDFDSAHTRSHLFADHPAFAKKVVLTKRIRWIEGSKGSPSFNHAWYVWDWNHQGLPTLVYGP